MLGLLLQVSLIKTIIFNFFYFPIGMALKFPVLVGRSIKIKELGSKSSVRIDSVARFGMVKLGLNCGSFGKKNGTGYWYIEPDASLIFNGNCIITKDSKIHISDHGKVVIGNGFSSNSNLILSCSESIVFGDDCLLGWNVTVIDGDGHRILNEQGEVINKSQEIVIGQHVWIASGVTILKKSKINDFCVIGANSTISQTFEEKNALIVGNPAKVVKTNISWEH